MKKIIIIGLLLLASYPQKAIPSESTTKKEPTESLFFALYKSGCHARVFGIILRNHECLNKKNHLNQTFLHLAAQDGNMQMIRNLMSINKEHRKPHISLKDLHSSQKAPAIHLANPYEKDNLGKSPFDYAVENNNIEAVNLFLEAKSHKLENNDNLWKKANTTDTEMFTTLVPLSPNLDMWNNTHGVLLATVATQGNLEAVRALIQNGANPERNCSCSQEELLSQHDFTALDNVKNALIYCSNTAQNPTLLNQLQKIRAYLHGIKVCLEKDKKNQKINLYFTEETSKDITIPLILFDALENAKKRNLDETIITWIDFTIHCVLNVMP